MKQKFVLCLLLFLSKQVFCQNNYPDSLRQLISAAKEDTNKVWLLLNLGGFYQWSYPDSGILYMQEGLRLSQKLNFVAGEIDAYTTATQAFSSKGNYPKALEAGLKALELLQKSRDSAKIIWLYANVGTVYYYSKDYERALYYFNKLKSSQAIFLHNQEMFSGFLGETYFHLNQLDSALYYIKISYELDLKSEYHWANPYFYLGEIYAEKKEYALALDYYHMGINVSTAKLDSLDGYIGIAGIFKKMNLTDSALYFARNAVDRVHNGSFPSQIIEASKILIDIYTTTSSTDSVLKYTRIMMIAKDSLSSQAKQNLYFNEQMYQQDLQQKIEKVRLANTNRQNMTILLAGLAIILILAIGLWRKNIYKQKSYALLQKQKQEIDIQKTKAEQALQKLRSTQSQLIQSEKMASLGELTAGIAHEIQNPLNFVNNFSEVNRELIEEIKIQKSKLKSEELDELLNDIAENEEKINHHGKRADAIVKGMLQHSRTSSGQKELTDINALCDEYLRLSYHGLRAKEKDFDAKIETDFDPSLPKVNVVPQDMGRVLLNLINNAFYVVNERWKLQAASYKPLVIVSTKKLKDKIEIGVKDNGNGIPKNIIDKIFHPFFTTKPTGQGTGLGLSLAYDIVKAHGGEIEVETKEGEGSEFIIQLPIH